jgi:hypothetical protein
VWVLVFTRADCPIANRYAPEVQRIADLKVSKGVEFRLVYVDPKATDESVKEHQRAYGYRIAAILDTQRELVKRAGATVTPEAAVFVDGKLVYRGRIDDRYVSFGKARPAPTRHDLEDAVAAAAAGKPVRQRTTKAVGCFIE